MLDPSVPVAGRVWYCGRWRTPAQAEKRRAQMRAYLALRYTDPEFRQRDRDRQAEVRRARGAKPRKVAQRQREAARARTRIKTIERRRAAEAKRELPSRRAPADVRAAWRDADENSIIRRKFPTMAALDASARRGDFDGAR